MNKKYCLMLIVLFIMNFGVSTNALAFTCNTSGNRQVAAPDLKKDTYSNVTIINMASYVTCNGNTRDNLRVYASSIDSRLTTYGFTGVLNIGGTRFDMPASNHYIWPYANSSATGNGTFAVNVAIELQRNTTGSWGTGITLPAGTVIASMTAQQRSDSSWGWPLTWNFVLNAPLVIPAYTCNVTNPDNRTITLPDADATLLRGVGKGVFTNSKTRFVMNLDCDVLATVDLSFNGTTMTGKDDVLANQASGGSSNIGIQVFPADSTTAIKFDNVENRMIELADATEILEYDAYYYVDGGRVVQPGQVKSTMTYTFTYK